MSDWCCEDCLVHVKTRLPAAVGEVLAESEGRERGRGPRAHSNPGSLPFNLERIL